VASTELVSDQAGHARALLSAPEQPGIFYLELLAQDKLLARAPFLVELSGVELSRPAERPELLQALAKSSGGRFFESPESAPDLSALDASRTTSLGSERHAPFANPLWALLAFLWIMFEWWLRRRWGER
jgi:hypothetical protein